MTEEKENCIFQQNYNVFGLDDKPCCYLYHKYCNEVNDCYFKRCKRLEQENKELKEELKSYKHPDVVTILTNWRTGELDRIHNKIANERDTYRSALEEIKTYLNTLSSIDNDFPNTEPYLRIQDAINEVLQ